MASLDQNCLDTLIVKATNPLVESPDPVDVASFCERVTHEADGAQIAARLLAYRIHSPQEKEALHALNLLEQCVKSCGPAFHSEIGKFRFLNELIKLVSPRYQAHRTPAAVKQRILDIIYTWTIDLKQEPKITEAFEMLKKQSVIKENPNYIGTSSVVTETPPPRQKNPIFDDSEKQATLQKLLRSKNAEDLQAANRLIKSMVREEERRQEMACRRQLEIETVNSNIRLLEELLDNFEANGATAEDLDLCKEMATNCDKLHPNLSRLATETDEKDEGLEDILRASDELGQILERYRVVIKTVNPVNPAGRDSGQDLLDLGLPAVQEARLSVLDEQLLSLGLDDFEGDCTPVNLLQPLKAEINPNGQPTPRAVEPAKASEEVVPSRIRGLEELDVLGETLLKQNLPANTKPITSFQKVPEKVPLLVLAQKKLAPLTAPQSTKSLDACQEVIESKNANTPLNPLDFDLLMNGSTSQNFSSTLLQPELPRSPLPNYSEPVTVKVPPATGQDNSDVSILDSAVSSTENSIVSNDDVQLLHSPVASIMPKAVALGDILLKFEDIKPSSKSPLTLLAQTTGLNITLHTATASVPKDVSVFVISTTSSNPSPICNFTFQAVVPKGCRVKLQLPSDNKLPAFNPFLPPPAITQIMLISSATMSLIDLKFVVSFDMDGETITELGTVSNVMVCSDSI